MQTISPANIKPQSIKKYSFPRRFIRGMGMKALLPVAILECFVTGGRTIQAYERGGFDEARERFTEEALGAFFWLGGIKIFNKMNDWLGQKILNVKKSQSAKLEDVNFDVGHDNVRNPFKNFVKNKGKGFSEKVLSAFKLTKIASSILLANLLVGFVVPKVNQKITVQLHNKREEKQRLKETPTQVQTDYFKHSINNFASNVPFLGSINMLSIVNVLENNEYCNLLSTDIGIAGGRAFNARNSHERIEVFVRDIGSIYFYLWCAPHLNSLFNKIDIGKSERLDPIASKQVTDHLKLALTPKDTLTPEEFKKFALGDAENVTKYMNDSINSKIKDGIINLDDFIKEINLREDISSEMKSQLNERAKVMSTLQPTKEGVNVLTKTQIEDVFRGGALHMPEFLNNLYGFASNKDLLKDSKGYKHQDPYTFVDNKDLEKVKKCMEEYIERIVDNAKKAKQNITLDTLIKADKINFAKNAFNRLAGFGVAALFLSTLIPKFQYWITKKTTGQNTFPGMTDYRDENKQK